MTYLRIYSLRPLTFIIILRQAQVNKGIKRLDSALQVTVRLHFKKLFCRNRSKPSKGKLNMIFFFLLCLPLVSISINRREILFTLTVERLPGESANQSIRLNYFLCGLRLLSACRCKLVHAYSIIIELQLFVVW